MPFLFQIQFTTHSFFWLLECLGLGIAYAFVLYGNPTNLKNPLKRLLFAIRAVLISLIAFLLVAPMVNTTEERLEKPLIILAVDNSSSILSSKASNFNIKGYVSQLEDLEKNLSADYELRTFHFDSSLKEGLNTTFDGNQTNISAVFKQIDDQFSNRNVGALILASDGIYNRGANPQYESKNLRAPIYTIALGDTIAKRDLLIANVNYNELSYLDNDFQIEISLEAYQAKGSASVLSVSSSTGIVYSKPISINADEFRQSIVLTLPANRKGIQRYSIRLAPVASELSVVNNTQTIYVEVIDGKQKVLILANSPHPDITALKQAIETNKNYSVKVKLASDLLKPDIQEAGLIILHQLPSLTNNAQDILQQSTNKPLLYILGSQSNIPAFVSVQSVLGITSSGVIQEVTAVLKSDFYAFTLSDANKLKISNFGPLLSPFGNYGLKGPSTVLISQQIGKLATERPLLVFGDDNQRRIGVLAAEGIWKWRLEDFQENANHDATNELIQKIVQYLSTREDKRKFRVYSSKNAFDENEQVLLNAELYNDTYQLVNTPDVTIALKSKSGKGYSYLFSRTSNSYLLNLGILPEGEYSYTTKTNLGEVSHQADGQFVVTEQQTEFKQSLANHQLLFTMAEQNGGKMLFPNQLNGLPGLIRSNETVKTVSYEDRKYEELINIKFIFFLIVALLSIEWFSRKRNGEV
ncbi:MAG: hypothetical protein HQ491_04250 [Bacteroidetes bacterium]|nr:hypothetical protein [Bacteroidota bacterium]